MGSISEDLLPSIEEYMTYYTAKRVQRKLNLMRQIEYHEMKRKHENCPAEVPGRKRFLFFSIVYLTGCTPESGVEGGSSLKQDEGWTKYVWRKTSGSMLSAPFVTSLV